MSDISHEPTPRPVSLLRWLRVPLALILVAVLLLAAPFVWHWADLDPRPIGTLYMAGHFLLPLWILGLLVWFVGFSGLQLKYRLLGLFIVTVLVGGFIASVAEMTIYGALIPTFRFRWEPDPQEELDVYLEQNQDKSGLPTIDLTIDPVDDFPRYRGLWADGVVNPAKLLDMKWESGRPRELWRHPCGGGFAGFAVAGNVAITLEQRGDKETIVCYDRKTGKQRWKFDYDADFRHPVGSGPRATPTIADGEVYSFGALGDLVCLDGATGEKKWAVNVVKDNQAKVVTWGMTSSPLVVDDLVIVNGGIDPDNNVERSLVAYNRKDGTRVWGAGKYGAGYSSPQLATLAGRRQVLLFDAGGLAGFDLKTGEELWRYEWTTYQDMNIIQPLVLDDDRVFISSETANGCALLQVRRKDNGFSVEPLWKNRFLCSKYANPIRLGNSLYGLSNGQMVCLDVESGKRLWRGKWHGHGQLIGVRGAILVMAERGYLALVAADRQRYSELGRMDVFEGRTWNTPAVAGRQLFLRNDVEMVCFELPLKEG